MLAALPIAVILLLMLGLRWSAARAGSVGMAVALLLAWFAYGLGTERMPELGRVASAAGAMAEAAFTAATILWIIFPALCIHELQTRTGGLDVLKQAMGKVAGDPRILALLVAWFFVLFVEGAAGFGTSAALAAPFLVSAGFTRVAAVSIAMIGHAVGVSFGAVGTPVLPQLAASTYSPIEIAAATANYHVLLGWMVAPVVMWMAARAMPGGPGRPFWIWSALAAVSFLVPYYLLARFVGPELPTLAGALLGAVIFVVVLKLRSHKVNASQPSLGQTNTVVSDHNASHGMGRLLQAAAPYLVLIVLVVLTRLIPSLQEALRTVSLSWQVAGFGGNMQILYHPGTMLVLSFLIGAMLQKASWRDIGATMVSVTRKMLPVLVALIAMLGLSRIMVHAGMIDALALAAASSTGEYWPLFAPAIGALGTFVTGSATASNILFTGFQIAAAEQLGFSVLALIAAQGVGAALGNIICPHNIVAASATVQLVGREGEVMRKTATVALIYTLLAGLLAWLVFA